MAATVPKEEWSLWHKCAIAHTQRTWPSKGWFLKLIQKTRHSFAFSLSWLDKRVLSERVAKLSSLVLPSKTLLVAMQSNSVRKPVVLSPRRTFQERCLCTLSTRSAKEGAALNGQPCESARLVTLYKAFPVALWKGCLPRSFQPKPASTEGA